MQVHQASASIESNRAVGPCAPQVSAVLVSRTAKEIRALDDIFRNAGWLMSTVPTLAEAADCARRSLVPVILAEADAADGRWDVLLYSVADLPCPPRLIVFSRLADERLWAEVLNLGGFDVISTPFDTQEVRHSVGHAWRAWHHEREPKPPDMRARRNATAGGSA